MKCLPSPHPNPHRGLEDYGLRTAQPGWTLAHSKFPVLGKRFRATNLLEGPPVAQRANSRAFGTVLYFLFSFCPIPEQFTAPALLSQFAQEQKTECSSSPSTTPPTPHPPPHPRIGAGGGGKDALKLLRVLSVQSTSHPPGPSGRSSSCLYQQRMRL